MERSRDRLHSSHAPNSYSPLEALFMPTPQAPIGSGFGAATTAAEVIAGRDLTGKTAVVTGGYSGIGVETVRAFRSAGAKVIVPARDSAKAKANLADMPDVRLEIMNLLDPGSIDAFAEQFLGDNEKLHILVNNAGIMAPRLSAMRAGTNLNSPPIISDISSSPAGFGLH